jgi:Protein of unknown function (DUF4239)
MNAFLLGTAIVVISMVLALAGLKWVRHSIRRETLQLNHEVAAAMISILGTLYAIVLGLVVVDALTHRELAQSMESTEANALASIMHLVRTLPVPVRRPIMQAELDYTEAAITNEWPLLSIGKAPDKQTLLAFGEIWETTANFEPKTPREQNIHASLLAYMTQMSDARRYRIVTCKHGMPSLLWLVLITGGFCTIGFTYFFGAEKLKAQMVMTAVVTLMLGLNILLVFFYGRPYTGDLQIEPSNLIHARDLLRRAPVLQKQKTTPTPAPGSAATPAPAATATKPTPAAIPTPSSTNAVEGKAPAATPSDNAQPPLAKPQPVTEPTE